MSRKQSLGNGWMGTILRVDLSEERVERESLAEDLAYDFVGGRGINSKILYDETGPHTQPLAPENRLIIGTGPVTGTLGPSAARFTVTAKSPLTGIHGDANGGGFFAPELKFAGYDHIVVHGKAERPVYIWIKDDEVTIRDARHLWGKSTWDTEKMIKKELGDSDIKTLCIGQAGEHMVRSACPIATGDRAPGRTGTGAVMGSKNLKAIAVAGSKSVVIAHPDRYMEVVRRWYDDLPRQKMYRVFSSIGTGYLIVAMNQNYTMGIRNVDQIHVPESEIAAISPDIILRKYGVKNQSCFACPTHCTEFMLINEGPYKGEKGRMPEGGSWVAWGPLVGVFDFPFILKATNMANQYGFDVMSTAAAISAAMKWFDMGIITREDTDGLELKFGNQQAILELMRKIAYREGFGDILAEGPARAARQIGKGAARYVWDDPKGMGMGTSRRVDAVASVLAQSTNTRGFEHLRGVPVSGMGYFEDYSVSGMLPLRSYDPRIAQAVLDMNKICTAADLLEICKVNTDWEVMDSGCGGVARMAELLAAITGVEFDEESLGQAAERVYDIEKAYNAREGLRRDDDNPPNDYFERPIWDGPSKGWKLDRDEYEQLKSHFYELKGWDQKTGAPTKEKLEGEGLKYVADELESLGIYQENEDRGDYEKPWMRLR